MIDIKEDCVITALCTLCDIVTKELGLIKHDLVESGNGDTITLDIITGAEIKDFYINTDRELYVSFKNGDAIKGRV